MNIVKKSENLLQVIKNVRKILFDKITDRDVEIWLNRLKKQIKVCNLAIKKGGLHVGTIRKLQTYIGHFKHFKQLISNRNIGMGLNNKLKNRVKWENVASACTRRVKTGLIVNLYHKDLTQFLNDCQIIFKNKIREIFRKKYSVVKVYVCFCGEFIRKSGENEISSFHYFMTKNSIIDVSTDIERWFFENVKDKINFKLSEFQERDSGFALSKIISLEVNINKFEIGNGSSYIKLPEPIQKKQGCINIKNSDQACFYWSIVSALYPAKNHKELTSSYPYYSTVLNTQDLEAPMPLHQISKFEKSNNISVNVYALDLIEINNKKPFYKVYPVRLAKSIHEKHVNLLLIQNTYFPKLNDYEAPPIDNDNSEITYHYCWIKDLSRLINSQLSKTTYKKFICNRCINYFSSESKLNVHLKLCSELNNYKMSFPKYESVSFRNYIYKQTTPFVVYADFECMLEQFTDKTQLHNKTNKYQKHIAYSAGYYVKCSYNEDLSFFKSYRVKDCMDWFANELSNLAESIKSEIKTITPMEEKPDLRVATMCHICEKGFSSTDIIVRDHDHFTGKFRNFAHQACNLNFKKLFVVPTVFHNLSNYDSHFIISELSKRGNISLLPINKEKYISFTLNDSDTNIKFRFIDSLRFLGASLEELAATLNDNDLKISKREFSDLSVEQFKLIAKKGVFCYDFIDSWEKLNTCELPPIEAFYNKLEDKNISIEKYSHAHAVWKSFDIENLGQYSDLYLKTDVLLLSDVFEQFRRKCSITYGLDPAWYYTMPGYTWDCMLKYVGCKLELLHDVDMIMFIEKAIRGGISVCSSRLSNANNKYMPEYDSTKPSKYLLYLDVNNLYGWAMCEPLPYGGFEWLDNENFDVISVADNSSVGYILQVDLEYPHELHDLHRDFPFAPEHRKPTGSNYSKLMTTLYCKKEYTVHYRNLKQMLANGLKIKKIHKILKFNQSAWLRPYIELNTRLRAAATNDFEKNLYKLANNAVFGKTMENIRKHRIVKLVKTWNGRYDAKNLISSVRFHSRTVFNENLIAVELTKSELVFNKPLYVGMTVLDLSKLCMYQFHYDYMIPKLGIDRCKLMYMDTDSFVYELICDDAYEEVLKADLTKFDTSDYPINNNYNIPQVNKKVLGVMKDENKGQIMTHFAGLRSKMYSFKVQSGAIVKKAKGVRYNVVKNKINFEDYVNCLNDFKEKNITQRCIRSYAHNVYSIEQTKIALSPHDDKRYLITNSYDTLPWGHYSIPDLLSCR
ncbi:uncharacterized protein LOC130894211 [Diorhabda carinulata]|uniref:uncharacterized protein LOC130894211 n=1 Tax=Diorhabda carinulata TaxID=1163345 RepID=UPI0025A1BFC8|nr:uncharacterized protein LOC130894211 [Diorhabda carinulata]